MRVQLRRLLGISRRRKQYHSGPLRLKEEGIRVDSENIVVTAVKPAMDGQGVILRAYESAGRDTACVFFMPLLRREFAARYAANQVKTFRVPSNPAEPVTEVNLLEQ